MTSLVVCGFLSELVVSCAVHKKCIITVDTSILPIYLFKTESTLSMWFIEAIVFYSIHNKHTYIFYFEVC